MADPELARVLDRRWSAAVAGVVAAIVVGGSSVLSLAALMPFVDVRAIHLRWASDALLLSLCIYPPAALALSRWSPLIVGTRRGLVALAATVAGSSAAVTFFYALPRWGPELDLEPARFVYVTLRHTVHLTLPFAMITAVIAGVVWSMQFERLRRSEERLAEDVQRRLARRGMETVRRHVQPRFIARAIEDLADRLEEGERPLLRLARHLRLLQRTTTERITLGGELRILRSMALVAPKLTVDVDIAPELEPLEISRGLAAAVGDLLVREDVDLHLRIASAGEALRITLMKGTESLAAALRGVLLADGGFEAATSIEEDVLVVQWSEDRQAGLPILHTDPAAEAAAAPLHLQQLMARLPLFAILVTGLSTVVLRADEVAVDGSRLVAVLLWCAAVPLLAVLTSLSRERRLGPALLFLSVTSVTMAAAISVASVLLFTRWSGEPYGAIQAWAMITDESAFLATAVAATVFVIGRGVRLEEARAQTAKLRMLLAQSETTAVESSFHPHFLFNALNTVAGLSRDDPQAAKEMLLRLAALFRLNVESEGEQLATVASECDMADLYLAIQRMRFGDRLQVEWDVPTTLGRAVVPRLVLQTFVENAVKHGIARLPAGGRIAIVFRRRWQRLVCRIVNDVPPAYGVTTIVHGGGLSYATARLALLYGGDARWQFTRGNAFAVQLEIPFRVMTEA